MLLAKVVGTVVSTVKEPRLNGLTLQVLELLDVKGNPNKNYVIAVDAVGAGVGEIVLYASGSSARQTESTNNKPCDAVIMAIVDSWDVDEQTVYNKSKQ
ncbi:MAG: EutN/CcmL family microcompartment protein [Candidatus Sericytochromatia bacterium]|nr:EutN/CcmL family microcompartment protein [Candidatus Sericytochromatia bacterium]